MVIKNGLTIGTAKVISNTLLKAGAMIPNAKITVKYVTAHNTGNWDVPANNYYRSLKRQNESKPDSVQASYHFVVDDKEIYQIIDTTNKTWHAGNSTGNNTSIGVEICMFKDKTRHAKAKKNGQELIAYLLKAHKLGTDKVKAHKDWSGKNCPQTILAEKNGWANFTKEIKNIYNNETTSTTTAPTTKDVNYIVRVTADSLNVRKGAGTSYAVVTTVKKGDAYTIVKEQNGWGYLKSGAGWICLSYTEKVK